MPVKTMENRYLPYLSDTYLADPLYKLYMLLFCTRDELLRARIKDLRRYKILPRQASVLMAVHTLGDKATPTEISRLLIRDSQTICEILSRMEKQGLIKRIKDPGNHKRVKIISTDKGDKAYYRSIERESIHNMFSCLSKEEQQQLTTCLVKIVEAALKENTKLKHMATK